MRALVAILAVAVVVGTSLWLFQQAGQPESLGGPEEPLVAAQDPELELEMPGAVPARSAASEPSPGLEPSLHGFAGRVVNVRDGQVSPAAGVRVELKQIDGGQETTAVTDEEGRFELPLEGPTVSRVFRFRAARDEEFREARRVVGFREGQVLRDDIELRRTAYAALTGRVIDPFGTRLPGVVLSFARGDGRPETRVVSDDRGEFLVDETAHLTGEYEASLAGYRFLWAHPLRPAESGGWRPIEVLLSPLASLVVRVLDGAGEPVAGAPVSLAVADGERVSVARSATWADGWSRSSRPTFVESVTDGEGSAVFEDCWSYCRLIVGHAGTWYDAVRAGTLVRPDENAPPLVLAPGAPRVVVVREEGPRVEEELRVEVSVRDEQGGIPERAHVLVRALDRTCKQVGEARIDRGDQGLFVGRLRGSLAECDVVAIATTRPLYGRLEEPVGAASAHARDAEEGVLRIEVTMGETLSLAGRIVAADGTPVRGYLRAIRDEDSPPGTLDLVAAPFRSGRLQPDGEFQIRGLDPGAYTLELDERRAGASVSHAFGGLPAGSTDLVLVIDGLADVNVHVRAVAGEARVARCIAVLGERGGARKSTQQRADSAPSQRELRDPGPWPDRVTLDSSGNVGPTFMLVGNEPNGHTWEGLRPGRYVVGVEGWDEEGRPFFPLASEPVSLGSGDHHFVAHLRPSAAFHGRVLGGLDEDLAVALEDPTGGRVSVFPNGKDPADIVPVTGAGRFSVAVAPSGSFALVVGTEEELRSGRPRKRVPLSLTGWSDRALEIDLR